MSAEDDRAAYLDRILIGGREKREVRIVPYDPAWPARFVELERLLGDTLGDRAIRIEHIGSTSVPGLAAKPVVDVLVTVSDIEDEAAYLPAIEAAGFVLRVREPGHRMFRTRARDVHIHVWCDDDAEVDAYLVFRDRLRTSEADRDLYAETKRALANREWDDMNDYADAKSDVVAEILRRGRSG